jgi:dipeptidyl aminopeptidase/acylaminoacyl peptidase
VGTRSRRPRLTRTVALAAVLAAAGSLTGANAHVTAWPATLAFSRPEAVGGGVFVLERSGRVRLLSARGLAPTWSPDGRRLAYVAPAAGGLSDVYVSDSDGKNRAPLTRTPLAAEAAPSWASDGRRLVVERNGRLFVIRADRRGERFLSNGREPAWSQKRNRIAFVDTRDGAEDLYLVRSTGRGLRRLTASPAVESQPAWSPDGKRLAYVALEGESTDLYVLDVASGSVVRLTQDVNGEASPAWGLGGRTITFVSDRPGGPVWSVPAAGGAATPLGGPQWVDQPAWRPQISLERPPDLDQRPPTDLSFRRTTSGRYLLGFTSATDNLGEGPLSIVASRPNRAVPTMQAAQRVRMIGRGARTYPKVGFLKYTIAPPHHHWHLMDFQRYELRRPGDHSLVVADRKSGFCLADHWALVPGHVPGKPRRAVFHSNCKQFEPEALAVAQGTSVGYTDRYPAYFHGQNLDVTRVPTGTYVLVHRANGEMPLRELRYENNAASLLVRFSWPRGRGHQPAIRVLRTCPDSEWCGSTSR